METRLICAAETHPLRSLVLRPGQPAPACAWPGDDDPRSIHVGAFVDGALVAIASVLPQPMPNRPEGLPEEAVSFRLRGMATHPQHRGQGCGAALLSESLRRVRAAGGRLLWCNARTSAAGFYQRYGFATIGEEFELPGIGPHVQMWIDLFADVRALPRKGTTDDG